MLHFFRNSCTLREGFVFYGAYHDDWRNKLLHITFVPIIFTTALSFLARVKVTEFVDMSLIVAGLYAVSFIKTEPGAGIPYAAFIFMMQCVASHFLLSRVALSFALHVSGWIAQFIAHGLFERRAPALLDDPLQAIHSSVFFVWLEIIFYFGYKPKLKRELDMLVKQKIAQLDKTRSIQ
ncbi:hypothetical protein DQ04_03701070 [Trypanosoma grayi]|uniref:hypothetical protein n=1 Tax=Trypanosoma grayi TaxID=71804 RepID=UPI0004F44B6E|nr:hypothetical protein DQ04_03701070 [Trypanosoma grayi]KEG10451.1 hypothetical protein DQ04_03701070 [Trypanosoma grayi]